MNWLREDWFWVLVFGLFTWVHLKMHGAHGHHGHAGGDSGGSGPAGHRGDGPDDKVESPVGHGPWREHNDVGH